MGTPAVNNESYGEYVHSFVTEVKPDLLAFDMYPNFAAAQLGAMSSQVVADSPAVYRSTLALFRSLALRHNVPLWNYFRSTDFAGDHHPATEAEMRWQTLTSLAYGATGLMYFNYPPGAIVAMNGTLGPLAAPAQRVNSLLLAYLLRPSVCANSLL
jgi:hypothetical protein